MVDFDCDARCVREAFNFTVFVTSSIGPRNFRRFVSKMRFLSPILGIYDGIDAIVRDLGCDLRKPAYKDIEKRGGSGGEGEQDLEEACGSVSSKVDEKKQSSRSHSL